METELRSHTGNIFSHSLSHDQLKPKASFCCSFRAATTFTSDEIFAGTERKGSGSNLVMTTQQCCPVEHFSENLSPSFSAVNCTKQLLLYQLKSNYSTDCLTAPNFYKTWFRKIPGHLSDFKCKGSPLAIIKFLVLKVRCWPKNNLIFLVEYSFKRMCIFTWSLPYSDPSECD